jgi:hypothetical protein
LRHDLDPDMQVDVEMLHAKDLATQKQQTDALHDGL